MIRCWGQAKFSTDNIKLCGYELFIREQVNDQWVIPADFSRFDPVEITTLLKATVQTMPADLKTISFNLDQRQFIDTQYCERLATIKDQTHARLYVELTERLGSGTTLVTTEQLVTATRRFHDVGIPVCLDDVGTGTNQIALIQKLTPYVSEYKFALQNIRGTESLYQMQEQVRFWRNLALAQHKSFVLEGFEDRTDLPFIRDYHPDIVQGYYFSMPHKMVIAADFEI